ncbi:WD40/YVTN/BNR-like repeat-containing protein [Falsibacillus albus]|uniref:Photosynthesis system II assembly factor Ycf48/Hcf136-like domain-containing protein n=1 Tax=Falsibacillus albus TaxID=2478915 RepID=A0A3L7JNL8_9BACI|nr:hypothetical protein [Falsibacillus albus]RLQ92418.1 hypothetical protein D9X91_19425 [Falsibacillus albus]
MKKIIFVALITLMAAALLSSCQEKSDDIPKRKTAAASTVKPEESQKNKEEKEDSTILATNSTSVFNHETMKTASDGWASTESKLFSINDNLAVDVTPETKNESGSLLNYYALDENHIWLQDEKTLFHSDNKGEDWKNYSLPGEMPRVEQIQLSFVTPQIGWLLVHRGAAAGHTPFDVYYTNTGGEKWVLDNNTTERTKLSLPDTIDPNSLLFIDEHTGFLTGEGNTDNESVFYRTNDKGKTWAVPRINIPEGQIISVGKPQFINTQTGFVAITSVSGEKTSSILFQSNDKGASWNSLIKLNDEINAVFFLNSKLGFLAFTINGKQTLQKTTDGGRTWSVVNEDMKSPLISFHFVNEQEGFGIMDKDGYHAVTTKNGGHDWEDFKVDPES